MFPQDQHETVMAKVLNPEDGTTAPDNFTWVTPFASRNVIGANQGKNKYYRKFEYLQSGAEGSVHDDEQFNPKRVLDAAFAATRRRR